MLLFASFLFFWVLKCERPSAHMEKNIHDDEMSFLHVIDPTRSIAIFNKNRVSLPLKFSHFFWSSFFPSNCDVLKCGNGDETFLTTPYLSFYSCCHCLSGAERFNSTWLQKPPAQVFTSEISVPLRRGLKTDATTLETQAPQSGITFRYQKPDVAQSPRHPNKIVIVFEKCRRSMREKQRERKKWQGAPTCFAASTLTPCLCCLWLGRLHQPAS